VSAALALLGAGLGRIGIQIGLQVFVAKAVEGMLASQRCGKLFHPFHHPERRAVLVIPQSKGKWIQTIVAL
jgi:hypothetical protein